MSNQVPMAEIGEIDPVELKARRARGDKLVVLDVREPEEIAIAPFPDATHIPMGDIPSRLTELDPDNEWVVVCHHGMRSAQVAMYLARMGFERVSNLNGGIDAWSLTADPATPRY
jgi:rhodanese-related sulfurtransferase